MTLAHYWIAGATRQDNAAREGAVSAAPDRGGAYLGGAAAHCRTGGWRPALLRKVRHRGVCKVHWIFTLACAAYNLVRMRNLAVAVSAA